MSGAGERMGGGEVRVGISINNNNTHDDVYGAVKVIFMVHQHFISAKRLPTVRLSQQT